MKEIIAKLDIKVKITVDDNMSIKDVQQNIKQYVKQGDFIICKISLIEKKEE